MRLFQGGVGVRQFAVATAAPARARAVAIRGSNASVSGAASSQLGERQMPMRGAHPAWYRGRPDPARDRPGEQRAIGDERAITPTVSRLSAISFMPNRLISPKLGL